MIVTVNDVRLEIERIPNIDIFSFDVSDILPEPQVPQFYIEEQDRWESNYNHPTYHAAMSVYFAGKTLALLDILFKKHIHIVDKDKVVIPKNLKRIYPDEDNNFIFLKYILLTEDDDIGKLIDTMVLTETRVYYIFKSIRVHREGMDIHQHDVKHTVNTNIEYEPIIIGGHQLVSPIDESSCCTTMNISYIDWLDNKFSLDSMAKAMAMYRINKIIEIHSNDAVSVESERKSRSKK